MKPRQGDTSPKPRPSDDADGQQRDYEPPRIVMLGTLAELTQGNPGTHTDFLGPGSQ